MQNFVRTLSVSICTIFLAFQVFAGGASLKPYSSLSKHFFHTVIKVDSNLSKTIIPTKSGAKFCSCQIMNLESANYAHNNVAVFAEKTNDGNLSANAKVTKAAIEKEKKQLKQLFYDKMKVVNHIEESTDCHSLYVKLKGADRSLVMYDVLDADIKR